MDDGTVTVISPVAALSPEDQLLFSVLPEAHRELLRRCAPLRRLDRETVDGLGKGLSASLEDLTTYPFVRPVGAAPGVYRLKESMRLLVLGSWWDDQPPDAVPTGLAKLAKRLAAELEHRPGTEPADIVELRFFVDPAKALDEWKDLFHEADECFDLVECRRLLDLLRPLATIGLGDVEATSNEYQDYVEARSQLTDDWHRTGAFVLPSSSRDAFESLLQGDQGRMLELRAVGGYGKTMHLRWFQTRRCVPWQYRVPCARLDFDLVDPDTAVREPHLVILEFADQLDRQLPGDAFGSLVPTYAAQRERLFQRELRRPLIARDLVEPSAEADDAADAADIIGRFTARLSEIPRDRPVVLILDTMEVAQHLPDTAAGPAARGLLEVLARVQRTAPCVRLVFSGRYDLGEELRALFVDRCPPFDLPKFTEDEAFTYLVDKRHLPPDDRIQAAVAASERVPFKLALLADLIARDPGIGPARIARYRGAEYAYLVERVVRRIKEQPVRWLLRYAAIPRRLDYEFVHDVLWPRIREGMAGIGGLDDPEGDDLPAPEPDEEALWQRRPEQPEDEEEVRRTWEEVKRYASDSSWISHDEEVADALRLQTDVVRPLRELLRGKSIVPAVHEDAVRYFRRRVDEADAADHEQLSTAVRIRRARWLREMVFHRFALEGADAGAWWAEQVAAATSADDRLALADELARGLEYTDRSGRPLPWGSGLQVSERTLQQARLELCLASAELATCAIPVAARLTLREGHNLWQRARDALARLDAGLSTEISADRIALAHAVVTLGTSPGEAPPEVATLLDRPGLSPRERLWVCTLEARRLVTQGAPGADDVLATATRLAHQEPAERHLRALLVAAVVQHHRQRGAYQEAITACLTAREEGLDESEFRMAEARVRLQCGDAERAREAIWPLVASGPGTAPALLLAGRCWRWQHRYAAATESVQHALALLPPAPDSALQGARVYGRALVESGETAAALLDVSDARNAFTRALSVYGDIEDREAAATSHLREATLLIRRLGHLRAAGVALDHADRAAPEGSEAALRSLLLRAELARQLEDEAEITSALEKAESSPLMVRPTWAATVAIIGLAFGARRDRDRHARRLATSLSDVTPHTARLVLLEGIERAPVLKPKLARVLREAVEPADGWDGVLDGLSALDAALLRLRVSALHMVLGDQGGAVENLDRAVAALCDGGQSPNELREALRLGTVLRSASSVSSAGRSAVAASEPLREKHPLLRATTIVEYVEANTALGRSAPEDSMLAAEAADLLLQADANAEAWMGRLLQWVAPTTTGDGQVAHEQLRLARQLYEAAGDMRRAALVTQGAGPADVTEADGARPVVMEVSLVGPTIVTKDGTWRQWLFGRGAITLSRPVRDVVAQWVEAAGPDPYPPALPDLMAEHWPTFIEALGEVLNADQVRRLRMRAGNPADLAVRVHDGALQPLPWELAADRRTDKGPRVPVTHGFRWAYRSSSHSAPDARAIRMVQMALNIVLGSSLAVDGISGPETTRVLQGLENKADGTGSAYDAGTQQFLHGELLRRGGPPRVVVARSSPQTGRRRSLTVERRYAHAGFAPVSIDEAHANAMPKLLRKAPTPVVVHIVARLVAIKGAVALDLQGSQWERSQRESPGFYTPTDLDRALQAVPPDWPAPVVVLDVPQPTGRRETAHQLLMRNGFAADLFAMGGARAVIGTGLAEGRNADVLQDVLVEGLARGDAIGDVVQSMRRQGPDSTFDYFATGVSFVGTALWTKSAGMRLPPARVG